MDRMACDAVIKTLTSQTLTYDDFTDGKSTSGYIAFTTGQIPGGSVVLGWKAEVTTAFACSSTCKATVGPTGNKDAWTTGDPSVATAGTVWGMTDFTDADSLVTSATTPYVEVTEDSDFGEVTAGEMTVTIYYLHMA